MRRVCKDIERAIDVLQGAVDRRPDWRLTRVSFPFAFCSKTILRIIFSVLFLRASKHKLVDKMN